LATRKKAQEKVEGIVVDGAVYTDSDIRLLLADCNQNRDAARKLQAERDEFLAAANERQAQVNAVTEENTRLLGRIQGLRKTIQVMEEDRPGPINLAEPSRENRIQHMTSLEIARLNGYVERVREEDWHRIQLAKGKRLKIRRAPPNLDPEAF
jgi:hypothetical protein